MRILSKMRPLHKVTLLGPLLVLLSASLVEMKWVKDLGPPAAPILVHSGQAKPASWFTEVNGHISNTYQHDFIGGFHLKKHRKRVAVLGGSVVHGGSVNMTSDHEFPALLGKKLHIDSLNLGNPALDSHDLVLILSELRKYHMDAWIVLVGHNDAGNTYFFQRYTGMPGAVLGPLQRFAEQFQLYRQLTLRKGLPKANGGEPDPSRQFAGPKVYRDQLIWSDHYFELNLRRMVWLAKRASTPLVLVVPPRSLSRAPVGDCIDNEECATTLWDEGSSLMKTDPVKAKDILQRASDADTIPLRLSSRSQAAIRRQAKHEHVSLVDSSILLPQDADVAIPNGLLFQDHVHLNVKGHKEMASIIAPVLSAVLGQ
jgi:lysophospholipase L1-like esterase